VPIYPTAMPKSIAQIVEHSEARAALVGDENSWETATTLFSRPLVDISMPPIANKSAVKTAVRWQDLTDTGTPALGFPQRDKNHLATIIYTSGTTGNPKGVMHSFANFSNAALGLMSIRSHDNGERILSYLPLAHAAERIGAEVLSLYTGCRVYFVYSLETFIDDLKRARPTVFFGVPRIWLKFQERIFQQSSKRTINFLLKTPIISGFVQRKIRIALGLDQARRFVSGASPISTSLLHWYSSIGIHIREGYGMTENLAYSHFSTETSFKIGAVGKTTPGVSAKISDEGEVLVKSPATMLGYYKDVAATQAAMTADGYLRTGDKGHIDSDGFLKITGRIKECFKTTKGKYITPAPIEALVMQYTEIDNVCVLGTGLPQPIALIVLSELGRQLTANKLIDLLAEMKSTINLQLDSHEHLQCLVVLPAVWSIESGELTPTLKVKRTVIEDKYSDSYQKWHDAKRDVIVL